MKFSKYKFKYYCDDWDSASNCLVVDDNYYHVENGVFGLPYFATREDAQKSIELHKKEWLIIFGIKEEDETKK